MQNLFANFMYLRRLILSLYGSIERIFGLAGVNIDARHREHLLVLFYNRGAAALILRRIDVDFACLLAIRMVHRQAQLFCVDPQISSDNMLPTTIPISCALFRNWQLIA